jgi:predicted transcriptional regulator
VKERRKRRSKEEIFSQILEACCENTYKTAIANKTNVNYEYINSYLKILVKNGMISANERFYKTTPKGFRILAIMKDIQSALNYPTSGLGDEFGNLVPLRGECIVQ